MSKIVRFPTRLRAVGDPIPYKSPFGDAPAKIDMNDFMASALVSAGMAAVVVGELASTLTADQLIAEYRRAEAMMDENMTPEIELIVAVLKAEVDRRGLGFPDPKGAA